MSSQEQNDAKLAEMCESAIGRAILKYAKEDKSNKLAFREDMMFEQVARVLRSQKAMAALANNILPTKLERFKKNWNALRPLYPGQTASLRQNHSSGVVLNEGEKLGKAVCSVIYKENDREQREALAWFNSLGREEGMKRIVEMYRIKEGMNE